MSAQTAAKREEDTAWLFSLYPMVGVVNSSCHLSVLLRFEE